MAIPIDEELIALPEHERAVKFAARIELIKDVSQFLTSRHIGLVPKCG